MNHAWPGATDLTREIKAELMALGFDAVGIAPAAASGDLRVRLEAFLAAGWHGEMAYLAKRRALRASPATLWPEARSAIVAGLSYAPASDPLEALERPDEGAVSAYAQGADYHDVLKKRLKAFARGLAARHAAAVKVFVDTAPVMEKPLAERAGIGWQGKHTNLVSRAHGSWLFLGVVLCDLDLEPDEPHTDHCGSCRACLDICPTRAFPAPYQLDARRCISYLTIEHAGPVPRALRAAMGNRIYGCDDCLAVCPWNKFAAASREIAFARRAALASPDLAALAAFDDAAFRAAFAGGPVKRIGRDRFVRNVLIAIGNSGSARLAAAALPRLQDEAAIVRGAAVWALSRLLAEEAFGGLKALHLEREADPAVRAEWLGQAA